MLLADLRILTGKHQGKTIPLTAKKFLVGREQDCHLRPNSDLVSRHHCVFTIDDYVIRLRDLGSTNGTLVNGEPIRGEVVLNAGDKVSIGKLEFQLVVREGSSVLSPSEIGTALGDSTIVTAPVAPAPAMSGAPADQATQDTSYELPAFAGQYAPPPSDPNAYPGMMPQQQPMPYGVPAYGNPMGYPQQPYGAPGYGMPAGYPQAGYGMPGYGMQPGYGAAPGYAMPYGYQPQPAYPQAAPQPEPAQAASGRAPVGELPVRLPPPEETGAVDAPPPAAAAGGGAPSEKPSDLAGDIIKQYRQSRVGR